MLKSPYPKNAFVLPLYLTTVWTLVGKRCLEYPSKLYSLIESPASSQSVGQACRHVSV